jgi:hypothetical protein
MATVFMHAIIPGDAMSGGLVTSRAFHSADGYDGGMVFPAPDEQKPKLDWIVWMVIGILGFIFLLSMRRCDFGVWHP